MLSIFLQAGQLTIEYEYDPLYRLTEANYSNGDYYHYGYDAVGNRLTQENVVSGLPSTVNYQYDAANRLTTAGGQTYTFDDNGNLLSDGQNTYAYDSSNRLTSVSGQSSVSSYQYSGLGDRLSQTMNGTVTNYTLDLNTGLTQVLSDGTNTYTYGLGRIAQTDTTTEYFLGDALGSVRQMTDQAGAITFAQGYDPYGVMTQTSGTSQTAYGYTGEQTDPNGMVYLRARYYNPADGRFTSRDTWSGDVNRPLSLNRWGYVEGNPVNLTDPSGYDVNYCDNPRKPDHIGVCAKRRYKEILKENYPDAFQSLYHLFTDRQLLQKYGGAAGTTSRGRLAWILNLTSLPFPLDFGAQFYEKEDFGYSDCSLREEFRDQQFYTNNWGGGISYQVGHFLTAVKARSMGFGFGENVAIGHEQLPDGSANVQEQYDSPNDNERKLWEEALVADERGDSKKRDELLWQLLRFDPDISFGMVDDNRRGNSLQDLTCFSFCVQPE